MCNRVSLVVQDFSISSEISDFKSLNGMCYFLVKVKNHKDYSTTKASIKKSFCFMWLPKYL